MLLARAPGRRAIGKMLLAGRREVCCWPGAMAELLLARGTVAELHREAFAGRGAAKCGKEGFARAVICRNATPGQTACL